MKEIVLVGAVRTAIGSFGGMLKDIPAADLGAIVIKEAINRAGIKPEDVDEVVMGCVLQAGLGQNVTRQAMIKAGMPVEIPAMTINNVCGSGLKAVNTAASMIKAGDADVVLVGGMENMSLAPYALPKARFGYRMSMPEDKIVDCMVKDGLWEAFNNYHMGITAENVAEKYGITREMQDEFAAWSQNKTEEAQNNGYFDAEIVPVPVKVKKEMVDFKVDEHPRATSPEALAKLKPAFKKDGMVTAGNASGINDGAAAIILASGEAVEKYGLKPLAKLVSWGQGGVDPTIMGVGPVAATKNAMEKCGLTVADMDLIEANEAFAAQSIAVARDLGFDMEKVNVNGGAISLGHPVGCSGARIIVTLIHEMLKRDDAKRGLATLCIGGGMGVATVWEKC